MANRVILTALTTPILESGVPVTISVASTVSCETLQMLVVHLASIFKGSLDHVVGKPSGDGKAPQRTLEADGDAPNTFPKMAPGTLPSEASDDAPQHDPVGGGSPESGVCPEVGLGPAHLLYQYSGGQKRKQGIFRRLMRLATEGLSTKPSQAKEIKRLRLNIRSLASAPAASLKQWTRKTSAKVSHAAVPAVPAPDTDNNNVAGKLPDPIAQD